MSGVYIHIPFCHAKCAYCDFYSRPGSDRFQAPVCRAIAREYELRSDELGQSPVTTLYVGGGTPSILAPEDLAVAVSSVPKGELVEFTIEANPEDICKAKIEAWRRMGVNRLSMGVQSFDDGELAAVGRRHTGDDAAEAFATLRRGGFENLSLDLIFGLPGQTMESWERTLDRLFALGPEHLSAYALSYEPGTRLSARMRAGKITPVDDDTVADMYDMLCRRARAEGYEHYEISNFSRPGYHSRHNSSYWDSTPYLGLGPAAHSFDGTTRRYNPSDMASWLNAIESGQAAFVVDDESERDRVADIIFTRLRTAAGLPLNVLPEQERMDLLAAARRLPAGSIELSDSELRIPEERWLVSDAIIADLLPE